MARLEDLNLTDEPVGDDIDYADLPPQDANYDHMWEALDDPGSLNAPGVVGKPGKSLSVPSSRSTIH